MKILKLSSIVLFSLLFLWIVNPQLSAKEHRCKSHSSFSFNLNLNPFPALFGIGYAVHRPAPVYVERTTVIHHTPTPYPSYREYSYSPGYYEERVIERRPAYVERVYVHPQYSYWGY